MSMHLPLAEIAQLLNCINSITDVVVKGSAIDSREIKAGDLFVALKGEHVDGHEYLAKAREAGAVAALVSSEQDDPIQQLVVDDVTLAFGKLAAYWRQQCRAKFVAITGSNGKTTVKEMVSSILSEAGDVTATLGNYNNDLGVPLTLTRIASDCDYAVIEVGTNHPGEIAQLVSLVEPDVSVITNIGAAHLEAFINEDGVATEKSSIYKGLKSGGTGVINADMRYATQWIQLCQPNDTLSFGLDNEAQITAHNLSLESGTSQFMVSIDDVLHFIKLPLPGKHNVANALAAITVAIALQIPAEAIVRGLAKMHSVPHRLQLRKACNDARLIDDSYNANPSSYQQALKVLTDYTGEHWVVLGDFGELGEDPKQVHAELGQAAKAAKVTRLFTIGEASQAASEAFGTGAQHFTDKAELERVLSTELHADVTCLIKASHFMRLDTLADALANVGES